MIPPIALELSVICLAIFLLMADAFYVKTNKHILGMAAILGLLGVLAMSFFLAPAAVGLRPDAFYVLDPLALFFKRFALIATVLTIVLAIDYQPIIQRLVPAAAPHGGVGEFYVLPVFICVGLMFMASAADFIMIFVSLELVTIGFYVMVPYMRRSVTSLEAGTKYLILGALSTGFLVYGITWIFGMTGQTSLQKISVLLGTLPETANVGLLFGLGLVLVALGFKIAAAPFQLWAPDVYQGAPTPVTAFLSVGSKAAGFVVLMRVLETFLSVPAIAEKVMPVVCLLAALTLIYGNLAAMPQTNLKRLLAYSSIAHAGYLLMGIASIGAPFAGRAVVFYLAGYLLMTFLAFLVIVPVTKATGGDDISHFNGLSSRAPMLAFALMLAMLSLVGLPLTVGFLGKFFIFESAMQQENYWLVGIGILTVACGFYYYLKVIRAMYWLPAPEGSGEVAVSMISKVAIFVLAALILILGVFPQPLLQLLP